MKRGTRICFIGDSFVNGTGDEKALGWVGRLCALASQQGLDLTYYNLGIRGNTSKDVLTRIDSEVPLRLGKAIDERIVLSFGVNDTLLEEGVPRVATDESVVNLKEIIQLIQVKYKILIVGPLPVNDNEQNLRIKSINTAYKLVAETYEIPFIDVFEQLKSNQSYQQEINGNDGAHPKSKGYETITQLIIDSGKWWF